MPFTFVVMGAVAKPSVFGDGASLEIPKSATFAFNLLSNNMLLALISRCMMGGSASV